MTHGDDKGFIRFDPLGGYHPKTLSAQRVVVHGSKDVIGVIGSKPIHIMSPEERAKNPKLEGTSGNLISEKSPKFPHLSVGHKPYEFIQKARCPPHLLRIILFSRNILRPSAVSPNE
jgi:hypothetical protein